jgi:RNA polymerase sigma-70 factor (ECF subfamily)
MLGSLHEAEDLVQETLLRAWRARSDFAGRASLRTWLYRIATNTCLNAIEYRRRHGGSITRSLPAWQGPPTDTYPEGAPPADIAWLEPYPDLALDGLVDPMPGPAARYELHESVQLAFVAAIQQLPPRQRAVLLLRDVLGWSAAEAADLLDASVAAVNSTLQRARATLGDSYPSGQPSHLPPGTVEQRSLVERYMRAWEGADLDGLLALLREDASVSMPPWPLWYHGRQSIGALCAWAWRRDPPRVVRLVTTGANGQPAVAVYRREAAGGSLRAHSIHVLTLDGPAVAATTVFLEPALFAAFGLPASLPESAA